MRNVAGIAQTEAQKYSDMFAKCHGLFILLITNILYFVHIILIYNIIVI